MHTPCRECAAAVQLRASSTLPLTGLEVLVEGQPLPTVRHKGSTYLLVPRLGIDYDIRVWNYGRDVDSPAYWVQFVRSGNERTCTLYYDTVEALRKAGVPVDGPIPFPGDAESALPPQLTRGM
jgi:hypothetical protein